VETGRGEPERVSPDTELHVSRYFITICYTALPHEGGGLTSLHRSELAKPGRRGTAAGQLGSWTEYEAAVYPRTPVSHTKLRQLVPVENLRLCCFSVAPRAFQLNWPQRNDPSDQAAKPRTGGLTEVVFWGEKQAAFDTGTEGPNLLLRRAGETAER
jgi:hypothetical protein